MDDTQPKKRTRIENFTPSISIAKQMMAEIEKYGALELLQEMIINNLNIHHCHYVEINLQKFINKLIEENNGLTYNGARLACLHASVCLMDTWKVKYDKMFGEEYICFSGK